MIDFPDLASLEKSQDGTEYIYGGSVGVNRILGFYRGNAFVRHRPEWTYHLFNVFTLVRNVYVKTMTDAELRRAFDAEVALIVRYVQAYGECSSLPQHRHPAIVFYIPDYAAFPKDRLRQKAEGAQLLERAYITICRHLPKTPTQAEPSVWVLPCGSRTRFPHQELAQWLRHHDIHSWREPMVLVTHCLTDLHLGHNVTRLQLLESYTGILRGAKQFGERLDASGAVPFTSTTHQVFGDSVHLQPLVRGVMKKTLQARAITHRWVVRTDMEIMSDVTNITKIPSTQLKQITFT